MLKICLPNAASHSRATDHRSRSLVAGMMTPDQVAEAQRLAREWDEAHPREP